METSVIDYLGFVGLEDDFHTLGRKMIVSRKENSKVKKSKTLQNVSNTVCIRFKSNWLKCARTLKWPFNKIPICHYRDRNDKCL